MRIRSRRRYCEDVGILFESIDYDRLKSPNTYDTQTLFDAIEADGAEINQLTVEAFQVKTIHGEELTLIFDEKRNCIYLFWPNNDGMSKYDFSKGDLQDYLARLVSVGILSEDAASVLMLDAEG